MPPLQSRPDPRRGERRIIVISGGLSLARVTFALFGLAIMVALELVFLRKLVQRIAGRRALRAEHSDDQ